MYIVPIGWLYVALMMAVAEATGTSGTILGAIVTFVLYGVAPVALVVYLMGSPARRRAIRAREAGIETDIAEKSGHASVPPQPSNPPDAGSHSSTAPQSGRVTPVGKES
jgi:hypothetical protein